MFEATYYISDDGQRMPINNMAKIMCKIARTAYVTDETIAYSARINVKWKHVLKLKGD
ncbi:hypothetical protein LCGC14_0342860 [marine sediment metagenome]|uniref:Uncharacterized protein n=1 Tax=marine sediment metagenome TaxID=412755 RepID=A0A0F9WKS1_9ZZZZ